MYEEVMTDQKKRLSKLTVFVAGLIGVALITFVIIWFFPGSMYGYGPGLQGLEVVAFLYCIAVFTGVLILSGLFTYIAYRIRRRRGSYGDFKIVRGTICRYWLPMSSVLSLCGIAICLIVAWLGPSVLSLIVPEETYRKIRYEGNLFVEFALRQEQAPWTAQVFQDAVQRGDLATIKKYLRYGADPAAPNGFGQTALHTAVLTGNEQLVRMFLDLGVDIAARDREGETPLHDACKKRNLKIVRLLIEVGADINARSDFGTPLDIAEDYHYHEAIDVLKQAGAVARQKNFGVSQ